MDSDRIIKGVHAGDFRLLARAITIVENDLESSNLILTGLKYNVRVPIIGITGPPGAGKSTFVNALIKRFIDQKKRVAVLAVDPTSPFNQGSLLGDRVRMSKHFGSEYVYIRSIATRGSLGGLSNKASEIVDILSASNFDIIFVETVGVGQSEIDIVKLAHQVLLLLVPDGGDEIQHSKSGIMEIADSFVVNKIDKDGAREFIVSLKKMLRDNASLKPVFETISDKELGIEAIFDWLGNLTGGQRNQVHSLTDKAMNIISQRIFARIDKEKISRDLEKYADDAEFNIYAYCSIYTNSV